MTKTRTLVCIGALAAGASLIALAQGRGGPQAAAGQTPALTQMGPNWDTYGGNLASHRYAPLDQINKDNFKNLAIAWRLKTDFLGPNPDNLYSATPLYVNGVLYTTAGTRRAAIALNPETGEMLWMHSEDEGPRGREILLAFDLDAHAAGSQDQPGPQARHSMRRTAAPEHESEQEGNRPADDGIDRHQRDEPEERAKLGPVDGDTLGSQRYSISAKQPRSHLRTRWSSRRSSCPRSSGARWSR